MIRVVVVRVTIRSLSSDRIRRNATCRFVGLYFRTEYTRTYEYEHVRVYIRSVHAETKSWLIFDFDRRVGACRRKITKLHIPI